MPLLSHPAASRRCWQLLLLKHQRASRPGATLPHITTSSWRSPRPCGSPARCLLAWGPAPARCWPCRRPCRPPPAARRSPTRWPLCGPAGCQGRRSRREPARGRTEARVSDEGFTSISIRTKHCPVGQSFNREQSGGHKKKYNNIRCFR